MNRVTVKSAKATGNKLTVHFECTGQIKKFFSYNRFFAEYSISIEDTPESILIIPFLSTVCPIAWANQADVYVEAVDETFLQALEKVKLAMLSFYPRINFSGAVYANRIDVSQDKVQTKSMMLFSGGIDALATYIRHQAENPVLAAVYELNLHGNCNECTRLITKDSEDFAKSNKVILRSVGTNFYTLIDELMLKVYDEKLGGTAGWWHYVMHGLALLGVCAPITYVDKIDKLYIASTFTEDYHEPCGSAPEIDNNVRWAETRCIHDGYELSRQGKMELIAKFVKQKNFRLNIHACNKFNQGDNCGKCEKCSRTIVGLELAGLNPNDHGFNVDAKTFSNIKESLENAKWRPFGADQQYMWRDLQRHTKNVGHLPNPEAKELINWLTNAKVETIKAKVTSGQLLMKFVTPTFKYLPYPVWWANRQVYEALRALNALYKRASYKRF
jgi:hypothetical protein